MALVPDGTVHCSRPPSCNRDLSSSDHAQGPCVGFIYIQLSKLLKNGPGMPKKRLHYKHTLPRLARSTLNELQQNQHEKASLVCVRVQSPSGLALVPCALSMVDLSGELQTSLVQKNVLIFDFWHPMLVRPAMKRLFCLKAKNGLGRFAPSALPHY